MLSIKSKLMQDKLKENWDEYTSPARFAGSDENLDLIFTAKRNDDKVKLVRRAKTSREPFACVFRGRLKQTEEGSEIVGFFTKSIFDYIIVAFILAILFYIRYTISERGDSLNTINAVLAFAIIFAILLLLNTRSAKRRYCEFLSRIAETENIHFLRKSEIDEDK